MVMTKKVCQRLTDQTYFISTVRSDLSQTTHRFKEEDMLGGILFLRLKTTNLRPEYRVLNSRHYVLYSCLRSVVYYESIKRELKRRKDDESTCLGYTGLFEELEYLKIEI